MKPRLLIVEDDEAHRTQMKWAFARDYEVHVAEDRASALSIVRENPPSVVLLDLGLPPRPDQVEEGFLTLADILREDPFIKAIIVTGKDEREYAVRAIDQAAYDFLSKPVDLDVLKVIVARAFYLADLQRKARNTPPGLEGSGKA